MTTRFDPSTDADRLDEALDALLAGREDNLAAFDPDAADVMHHLQGWAQLAGPMDSISFVSASNDAIPAKGHPMSHAIAASPPSTSARTAIPHRNFAGQSLISVVSWIVIVAILASAAWGIGNRLAEREPSPTISAFQPPAATPEAILPTGAINYGGDAGHSWNLGDVDPFTKGPSGYGQMIHGEVISSPPLVVGTSIIVTLFDPTADEDEAFHTVRYDIGRQSIVWVSKTALWGPLASDGAQIYGTITIEDSGTLLSGPAALDFESGELISSWTLWPGVADQHTSPILDDGELYWGFGQGRVAVIRDGEMRESIPSVGHEVIGPTGTFPGSIPPATNPLDMVVDSEAIYLETTSSTVFKMDRRTLEVVGSFNVVDDLQFGVRDLSLQIAGDRLIVGAMIDTRVPDAAAIPTSVLIYDTATLSMTARQDVADLRSNLVVGDDAIFAATRLTPRQPLQLWQIDPLSGRMTGPISDLALDGETNAGLSLAGNTLMAISPDGTLAFVDIEQETVVMNVNMAGKDGNTFTVFPIQMSGKMPVTIADDGEVIVVLEEPSEP